MARPHIDSGELGAINLKRLKNGRYRARATPRDDRGAIHRLAVTRFWSVCNSTKARHDAA